MPKELTQEQIQAIQNYGDELITKIGRAHV